MWAIKQTINSLEDSGLLGCYNPSTGKEFPAFQSSIEILQGQIFPIMVDPKVCFLKMSVPTYLPVNTAIIILCALYGHATVVYCQCIIFIWYDTNIVHLKDAVVKLLFKKGDK